MMTKEMLDFLLEDIDRDIVSYVTTVENDLKDLRIQLCSHNSLARVNNVAMMELQRLLTKRSALMQVRGNKETT